MREFQQKNSDFVTLEYLPKDMKVNGNLTINHFFKNCCDKESVYVRFDDDIVCIQDTENFEKFLNFRIQNPQYFLVYANIINNGVLSHVHQRIGLFDTKYGFADYEGYLGWKDGNFAKNIHTQVLNNNCKLNDYEMNNWILYYYERVSINVVSFLGEEMAKFEGNVLDDEEYYISCVKPKEINKCNIIFGEFVCVHYAFYTQRPEIDKDISILSKYLENANNIN
jgi:hypothetical protein